MRKPYETAYYVRGSSSLHTARVVDTHACATITRKGRRVANVRIEAWQDERAKPVALAHGHFLLT